MKYSTSRIKIYRENEEYEASIALVNELFNPIQAIKTLHEQERKQYEGYKFKRKRLNYLLGRYSAKLAVSLLSNVSSLQNINITSGVFGFPIISCKEVRNIQVGITHCDTIGVSIAYKEEHPMGVDVEKINLDKEKTILSQISDDELQLLKPLNKNNISGYTAIWCAKEALAKILKTGMMLNFSFLELESIIKQENTYIGYFKHFKQYKVMCYTNKEYAIAIALPGRSTVNLNDVWELFNRMFFK